MLTGKKERVELLLHGDVHRDYPDISQAQTGRASSGVGFMHGKQEKTSLEQTGGHVISPVSTMQTSGEEWGLKSGGTLPERLNAAIQLFVCTSRLIVT